MTRKRVRFAETLPEEGSGRDCVQRTYLPEAEQGDDDVEDDEVILGVVRADADELAEGKEPAGPVKGTNPEQAAARRLARRRELEAFACAEDELSLLEAIAEAEEEYEAPGEQDDTFWSNSGVPIEPFHLKSERQGGYFDAEGTYIEFKDSEAPDAWLDSLPKAEDDGVGEDNGGNDGGDDSTLAPAGKDAGEQVPALSEAERRERRQQLAALLQPGETALDGLRRLGGLQRPEGGARAAWRRRRRSGDAAAAPTSAQGSPQRQRTGRTVPPENLEAFNHMTELSSTLLAAGDFTIHSRSREALLAELAGGDEPGPGSSGVASSTRAELDAANVSAAADNGSGCLGSASMQPSPAGISPGTSSRGAPGSSGADRAAPALAAAQAADPDVDIYAEEAPHPGLGGAGNSADMDADECGAAGAERGRPDCSGAAGAASVSSGAGQGAARAQDHMDAEGDGAAAGEPDVPGRTGGACATGNSLSAGQGTAGAGEQGLGDYVFDEASGCYYSSQAGCWFDPARNLYADAASGQWYSVTDSGQGQPVQ